MLRAVKMLPGLAIKYEPVLEDEFGRYQAFGTGEYYVNGVWNTLGIYDEKGLLRELESRTADSFVKAMLESCRQRSTESQASGQNGWIC